MMFLVVEAYRANRYTIQPQHSSITMRGGRKIAYFRLLAFFFQPAISMRNRGICPQLMTQLVLDLMGVW